MITQTTTRTARPTTLFAPDQRRHLRAPRTRYRQQRDLFSAHELARLRFLRWLYQQGRLVP